MKKMWKKYAALVLAGTLVFSGTGFIAAGDTEEAAAVSVISEDEHLAELKAAEEAQKAAEAARKAEEERKAAEEAQKAAEAAKKAEEERKAAEEAEKAAEAARKAEEERKAAEEAQKAAEAAKQAEEAQKAAQAEEQQNEADGATGETSAEPVEETQEAAPAETVHTEDTENISGGSGDAQVTENEPAETANDSQEMTGADETADAENADTETETENTAQETDAGNEPESDSSDEALVGEADEEDSNVENPTDPETNGSEANGVGEGEKNTSESGTESDTESIPEDIWESSGDDSEAANAGESGAESMPEEPEMPTEVIIIATVSVVFHDDDNRDDVRPGGVFVTLIGDDGSSRDIQVTEESGYSASVEVPMYNEAGEVINYHWEQELLVGYGAPESSTSSDEYGIDTVFVNTHVSATCTKSVVIEWEDDDDREGIRPESVTITLYDEDDNEVGQVEANEENGWSGSIEGLPLFNNGKHIEYHWRQEDVPGYQLKGSIIDGSETTLINEYLMETISEEEEVPVEVKKYTLTVRYWVNRTTEAFPDYTGVYEAGQTYSVTSPARAGYRADKTTVRGTIRSNTVINVYYTANTYNLTIYYRYLDGSQAAGTYRAGYQTDSSYSVETPYIGGYTPSRSYVSGTMPGRNVTVVVYYTRNRSEEEESRQQETESQSTTEDQYTVIDDYGTPLGLGAVTVNAGDCFE